MPRPSKRPPDPEETTVDIGEDVIPGTPAQEEPAAKEYKPADLGLELNPYRVYSDKFFSPLRQQAYAEERKRRSVGGGQIA
jgi:hypothetical protein